MIRHARRASLLFLAMTIVLTGAGCPKQAPPEQKTAESESPAVQPHVPPPVERPAAQSQPAVPAPAPVTKPAETQPAASQPASTYEPRPPYTVKLFVRNPQTKQPGWLKILKLADEQQPATAEGVFPEQNDISISTGNVERIQVQIGFLPLAPRKRTFLHIDRQGIEIVTKGREFVILERSPAGAWSVVPQKN
jgi:hypothetical protein